jgi:hypothetical protein
MKAIQTKYLGPTNTKPSRIRASAEGVPSKFYSVGRLIDQTGSCHAEAWHRAAAQHFQDLNGWTYYNSVQAKGVQELATGQTGPDTSVHCFVQPALPSQYHVARIVDYVWGGGCTISREDSRCLQLLGDFPRFQYEAALRHLGLWKNVEKLTPKRFVIWWKKNRDSWFADADY